MLTAGPPAPSLSLEGKVPWSPATQGVPKTFQGPAWPERPDSGSLNELREADCPEVGQPSGQPSNGGLGSLGPRLEKQTRLRTAGLLGPAAGWAPDRGGHTDQRAGRSAGCPASQEKQEGAPQSTAQGI